MQAWGSGASMLPPNYVVPNVTFADPYAQYPQPKQTMAIIGGYAAGNMQNIAAINPTQLNWVRAMQILPMSLGAFT
jgi:hypothetical protein